MKEHESVNKRIESLQTEYIAQEQEIDRINDMVLGHRDAITRFAEQHRQHKSDVRLLRQAAPVAIIIGAFIGAIAARII